MVLEAGIVEFGRDPIVEHGFLSNHGVFQAVNVDQRASKLVA